MENKNSQRSDSHWRQPRRGCRGHIPQYFGWGDVNGNISPILLHTFGYSRPILVALRSLSLNARQTHDNSTYCATVASRGKNCIACAVVD